MALRRLAPTGVPLAGLWPSRRAASSRGAPATTPVETSDAAALAGSTELRSRYKAVVVGGGVVGASVLYHLAKLGWRDVALLERKVLTAGSSWHAAGGFHALNGDPTVASLQAYTIALYKEIQEISGHDCGVRHTGGVNFASTPERWEFLQNEWAKHRTMGIDSRLCNPDECRELIPLLNTDGVIGGLFDKNEGHLDCAGVTWAYAKSARKLGGGELHQHTKVTALTQVRLDDDTWGWEVETNRGTVVAEHVVNCGGLWAREVGAMAGVHLPLLPMQHHYVVTEDVPEVRELRSAGHQLHALDLDGENYMMTQGDRILIGVYEQDCRPWGADGSPWDWGEADLCQPDLDRIAPELERAFDRYPVLQRTGIARVLNGPFTFAPDGNPLVGPVAGTGLASSGVEPRNFWVACAVMAGFSQGGGVGLSLAEWMVHGLPMSFPDVSAMDVARFGPWASRPFVLRKAQENYQRRFRISYPNEELPAARGLRVSPLHEAHAAHGAVFGASFGLEYPKYFSTSADDAAERFSFHRSNAFSAVAAEVAAVRGAAGAFDMGTFAKYEVSGPSAREWLDAVLACRLPPPGKVALAPMLDGSGRLAGDFTVASLGVTTALGAPPGGAACAVLQGGGGGGVNDTCGERFLLVASGHMQGVHARWFFQHRGAGGVDPASVVVRNVTDELGGVSIAGPASRDLLQAVAHDPSLFDSDRLPLMGAVAGVEVALARATVCRLSVTGELGFEVTCAAAALPGLWRALRAAGAGLGLAPCGSYAMDSLRLEKSYGKWDREFTPDFTPAESGLARCVALGKPASFVGKAAAVEEAARGPSRRLVTLVIDEQGLAGGERAVASRAGGTGGPVADASGYEPVWSIDGDLAGFTTSGGYGHSVGKSIAMAYVAADRVEDVAARGALVHVLGSKRAASVAREPLHDPAGLRMRA